MSTILVIACDTHGPRLRSDLIGLGHVAVLVDRARLPEADVSFGPDLVLMDVDAGEEEPGTLCRAIRDREAIRKAAILAVVDPERVRELDFSSGLGDFIIRSYDLSELDARIRLTLWRDDRLGQAGILKVGDILINLTRYEVRFRGAPIELTLKEYELLKHLAANRGRVFTRGDLLNQIWGYNYYGGMRTVDVHIRRVRSKLEGSGETYIKTIRGVGYRFESPSRDEDGPADRT